MIHAAALSTARLMPLVKPGVFSQVRSLGEVFLIHNVLQAVCKQNGVNIRALERGLAVHVRQLFRYLQLPPDTIPELELAGRRGPRNTQSHLDMRILSIFLKGVADFCNH